MITKEITARLEKVYKSILVKNSFDMNLIRKFFESLKHQKPVPDKVLNELWLDLYDYYTKIVLPNVLQKEDWQRIFDTGEGEDQEMFEKIEEMREEGYDDEDILKYMDEKLYSSPVPAYNYSSEECKKVIQELKNAKTDGEKIAAINIALNQYHDNGNVLGFMNSPEFEEYNEYRSKEITARLEKLCNLPSEIGFIQYPDGKFKWIDFGTHRYYIDDYYIEKGKEWEEDLEDEFIKEGGIKGDAVLVDGAWQITVLANKKKIKSVENIILDQFILKKQKIDNIHYSPGIFESGMIIDFEDFKNNNFKIK